MKISFVFVLCLPTFTLVRHTSVLRFHTKMHLSTRTHSNKHFREGLWERQPRLNFWMKITQHGYNTCPTSVFGRRGCGLVGICCKRVEEAVCLQGDKVSKVLLTKLLACVAQAAHMKQFDQRQMGGDELCFCGRKKKKKLLKD